MTHDYPRHLAAHRRGRHLAPDGACAAVTTGAYDRADGWHPGWRHHARAGSAGA